jgi:transcriptional regulator of acetoin/glycerol metabolism
MPVALQAHLLRVLQERQVTPLGSTKSVAVDVNIICATHRNLREMIDAKTFREDLFYRLNGLAVRLPPLRERSDLLALVRRILDQLTETGGGRQRHLRPDAEVLRLFQHYSWPGNVRQLFNVLRTAAVMAANEPVITREHLSDDFLDEACAAQSGQAAAPLAAAAAPAVPLAAAPVMPAPPAASATPPNPPRWSGDTTSAPRSLEDMEIDAIRRAVDEAGGNISEASKRLGISRNTIYRKLRWNAPK